MQHLGKLWKAISLVSSARDLGLERRSFQWEVGAPNTFFLQAEQADIRLSKQEGSQILAKIELRAGFGWQLATDQDEAGVYIVARRKPVVGSIARAKFDIILPPDIHIALKLENCQLCLNDVTAVLDFPPEVLEG